MVNEYTRIMAKYLDKQKKGLTKKGIEDINKVVELIGKIGLVTGLELSKALIENYFLDEEISNDIIAHIDKEIYRK